MERKNQMIIGSGALVGLVGLYFAWNFYSFKEKQNIKLDIKETDEKMSK
jgi:hypothetical protein